MSHFVLLAYTLRSFYVQGIDAAQDRKTSNKGPARVPRPEPELAVHTSPYFALLFPSGLVTVTLEHMGAWRANREQLLLSLGLTEGNT